jgi:hypothetical protein
VKLISIFDEAFHLAKRGFVDECESGGLVNAPPINIVDPMARDFADGAGGEAFEVVPL